ncbi:ABC transporter permease [Marilutibacter alkalisoli]|uniref:FtsX-like permease family protein n=1 Tax=Marilutibacter alkalisoli TaxID=2591633 RepID=A0A514BNX1_9GAMM|nr:FtsX-like permease family protein [Lysobacter alkalisoli]QDH69025.1 FtsX-like permease family protein [Lysobacter alkalisoli]
MVGKSGAARHSTQVTVAATAPPSNQEASPAMSFHHALSLLRRRKASSAIIILEIAISCAILCNAAYIIGLRLERASIPSGVAEREVVRIQPVDLKEMENPDQITRADIAALRAIPGVRSASLTSFVPFGQADDAVPLRRTPDQQAPTLQATAFIGDTGIAETLGLRLIAGRLFDESDTVDWPQHQETKPSPGVALLTRSVAEQMFPEGDAVGRIFYIWSSDPVRVVGVVEHLKRGYVEGNPALYENSVLLPIRTSYSRIFGNYVLRADPGLRTEILDSAARALMSINGNRAFFSIDTFEDIRDEYFRKDLAMAWLLTSICSALLAMTAFGIVGIVSFWVQQRFREIGILRSLGAARTDIMKMFLLESFLLTTIGIAVGMLLAYAINIRLMDYYEIARMPIHILPLGATILWLLGVTAALYPATRAAMIPPATATRLA